MLPRIALALLLIAASFVPGAVAQGNEPTVYVFWGESCPFSQRAMTFIAQLRRTEPALTIRDYEIENNPANARAHVRVLARIGIIGASFVPLIVVGENAHIGYENDATSGEQIFGYIRQCRTEGCPDRIADVIPPEASEGITMTLAPVTPVCTAQGEVRKIGARAN